MGLVAAVGYQVNAPFDTGEHIRIPASAMRARRADARAISSGRDASFLHPSPLPGREDKKI